MRKARTRVSRQIPLFESLADPGEGLIIAPEPKSPKFNSSGLDKQAHGTLGGALPWQPSQSIKLMIRGREERVESEVLTWFPDGSPLGPVSKPSPKVVKPMGRFQRAEMYRRNEQKRRRERWLDKIHRKQIKSTINDRRQYYRTVYLKSEHWNTLKRAKLKLNPNCEKCGESYLVDVHHLNYRNLYDVRISDLQSLCRGCHHKEHPDQIP